MPDTSKQSRYTDSQILDLIEDYLVNQCGIDDIEDGDLDEILDHISDLVELRRPRPSCDGRFQEQLDLHIRSTRAALEFGSTKHAAAALQDLSTALGCPEEPRTLLGLFERKYIAKGFLYSGTLLEKEIEGFGPELARLLADAVVIKRQSLIPSYELSPTARKELIERFDLGAKWELEGTCFHPHGDCGEITCVYQELSAT